MTRRRSTFILGLVVLFSIIAFLLKVSLKQPKIKQLQLQGDSQIALALDNHKLIYTSFAYQIDSTIISLVLNKVKKPVILKNKYFGGLLNDSLGLFFDLQNRAYLYELKDDSVTLKKSISGIIKFDLDLGSFHPGIQNSIRLGFYFIKSKDLCFFNLIDSTTTIVLSPEVFADSDVSISSFDIRKEKVILSLKKNTSTNHWNYDYYLYNLLNKTYVKVFQGVETDQLAYEPIVKFIDDNTVITSYYHINGKSTLETISLKSKEPTQKYELGNYKVINIIPDGDQSIYLTLLNEKTRENLSKYNRNVLKGIYGGIHVYKINL